MAKVIVHESGSPFDQLGSIAFMKRWKPVSFHFLRKGCMEEADLEFGNGLNEVTHSSVW